MHNNVMRKRQPWLILLLALLLLALSVYLCRQQLERAVIAYRVYSVHIFTPPPPIALQSRWHRLQQDAQFYWDFSEFHVARAQRLKLLNPLLRPLIKEIDRRQARGESMLYSMHIYREIRWRLNFTPDIALTRARIADLRRSLEQPELQKLATEQQPSDGSWGLGLSVWYLKLYYAVEDDFVRVAAPRYPLSFLDRINSPPLLAAQLNADLHDDFTKSGVFNREELDETFSALARLLLGHKQIAYPFHPELKAALLAFVERWQNPVTGCWGQWLLDRHGRIWKMDDMAMTFHVVSDLHGQIHHLDRIANRVLQLDPIDFPAGIRFNGHYENHLNWDVVKIFRAAWPSLDDASRQRARAEISQMLAWCLSKSYQPDGSFKVSELDDTVGDAYMYGVNFLKETGYFRREDRFWTAQEFPASKTVHDRIKARLASIGLNDLGIKTAYQTLLTVE